LNFAISGTIEKTKQIGKQDYRSLIFGWAEKEGKITKEGGHGFFWLVGKVGVNYWIIKLTIKQGILVNPRNFKFNRAGKLPLFWKVGSWVNITFIPGKYSIFLPGTN